MSLDAVETLSDLVAIPSVNPMGRDLSGPEYFEYKVTEYLEALFDRLGLPHQRQTVEPLRDNIVARFDGDPPLEDGGTLLMFEAHQDTVPVDGMTIDPWSPFVADGRIYGRGSCDIKGGMTAMLVALARLIDERPLGRPTIVMACTVNEEHGYSGVDQIPQLWQQNSDVLPRRPDAAIVAEPTNLNVVVAHKGAVRWRCRTRGRAIHSSQPQLGINALYRMAPVLSALDRYQREIAAQLPPHPRCGSPTLSVGTIRGGISVNTVPDECEIEIDRRVIPGETSAAAYQQVLEYLAQQPEIDFELEHERPFLDGAPLGDEANGHLAEHLLAAARRHHDGAEIVGVPYGTDASKLAAAGVPTVVFGPGSVEQAHTADEWLDLDELATACGVLYEFAAGGYTPER